MRDMPTDEPFWNPDGQIWYAALVSGGRASGLIRRTRDADGVAYEFFDRRVIAWAHDPEGITRFSGIGGVTDAEPIPAATADELLANLIELGPRDPLNHPGPIQEYRLDK